MNKVKLTYVDSLNKKAVRDFLIEKFNIRGVVGLAGPDIIEYIQWFKSKGAILFDIYEEKPEILLMQLSALCSTKDPITLIYGDVINADNKIKNTLYDLDFCCSILSVVPYVKRFRKSFIMTFSSRSGVDNTIDTFFDARKENVLYREERELPIAHSIYVTDEGEYIIARYKDTSAMCSIAKIN